MVQTRRTQRIGLVKALRAYRARAAGAACVLPFGAACLIGCAPHRHPRTAPGPWAVPSSRPWLTSRPTTRAAVRVSPVSERTLPEQLYFYASAKTTALDVQKAIEGMTAQLQQAADEGRVTFTGPCVFVFHGRTAELRKPFLLEIGFVVAEGTRPFGRFQVRRLAAFRCAAVTMNGPGGLIDKAYDVLDPEVDAAHLRRRDEAREIYTNWQGPDSPDDEILVGIGVR